MAKNKLEVNITSRYCICCGVTPGAILIAIYCIFVFLLFIGLAAWGYGRPIGETQNHYQKCLIEAQSFNNKCQDKFTSANGTSVSITICDASSYHCSLGLYTEELKYNQGTRGSVLLLDIILWALIVLASVLVLIAICLNNEFLLLPWMILMILEIVRGTVSVILIFVYCYGNLARIAVGIFFLGVQIFHLSLLLIIIAKFYEIRMRNKPIIVSPSEAIVVDASPGNYPTMPAGGSYSTMQRRDGYYHPSGTLQRSDRYGTYGGRSTMLQ